MSASLIISWGCIKGGFGVLPSSLEHPTGRTVAVESSPYTGSLQSLGLLRTQYPHSWSSWERGKQAEAVPSFPTQPRSHTSLSPAGCGSFFAFACLPPPRHVLYFYNKALLRYRKCASLNV